MLRHFFISEIGAAFFWPAAQYLKKIQAALQQIKTGFLHLPSPTLTTVLTGINDGYFIPTYPTKWNHTSRRLPARI